MEEKVDYYKVVIPISFLEGAQTIREDVTKLLGYISWIEEGNFDE